MAIEVVSVATAGNRNSEASTSTTLLQDASPGDLILVAIAADNAGTSGAAAISGVSDDSGNTYSQVEIQNRTPGNAANDGCTVAIYGSVVVNTITNAVNLVTIAWSPNVSAKAIVIVRIRNADPTPYSKPKNSGSGTTYTSNASTSMSAGDLFFGAVANESNTAPGTDTDTTNGSWSSDGAVSAGSGGDATKMALRASWKVVAGAGAQTLNGSTGANTDWALVAALYQAPATDTIPHNRALRIAGDGVSRASSW